MGRKNSIIYQCYVNLLTRHPRCRHHCSCHYCHCPLCCLSPLSPLPSSSSLPPPLPLLARHTRCRHHCPLRRCCSPFTRNPCPHHHRLVALTFFTARHPYCHCHRPCSLCPLPLCHLPDSLPSPFLSTSPLAATLDAVAIALATIAIALFALHHPHRSGHCPLCCHPHFSAATLVAFAIVLFPSAATCVDCHCPVAAVLPSIAPPPLTAIGMVPLLSLSPIVTPAIAHRRHHRLSPPPLPILITLPYHRPLRICHCCPSQLCCHYACCPSTCPLVVTLDWLSLCHLHANGVVVSHLFPAMDIGVTALPVAAAVFLGAVIP
jgi:hypothetical protein